MPQKLDMEVSGQRSLGRVRSDPEDTLEWNGGNIQEPYQ